MKWKKTLKIMSTRRLGQVADIKKPAGSGFFTGRVKLI